MIHSSSTQSSLIDCPMSPQLMQRLDETLAHVLEGIPETDRLPLLAHLEQKYRRLGDLSVLQVCRAYRAKRGL